MRKSAAVSSEHAINKLISNMTIPEEVGRWNMHGKTDSVWLSGRVFAVALG